MIPTSRKRSIVSASKQAERDFAELLGGKRVHSTGLPDEPDVDGGWWVMETKHRKIPQWILDAMDQAKRAAAIRPGDPMPLVGLKDKRGTGTPARMLIVVEAETWERWNGQGSIDS